MEHEQRDLVPHGDKNLEAVKRELYFKKGFNNKHKIKSQTHRFTSICQKQQELVSCF